MKRVLTILSVMMLAGYLLLSVCSLTEKPNTEVICKEIDVRVYDSLGYNLIDKTTVMNLLRSNGMDPIGRSIDMVNTEEMERMLLSHSLISEAQCFKTIGGNLKIRLKSRVPVIRIMNSAGQDYYLDSHGDVLNSSSLVVNLPIATGNISHDYARKELMYLINTINGSDFWKAQIEQIFVSQDKEVTLVPRVGGHIILLGHAEDLENKLDRLFKFYKKCLDVIGWSKYSSISVAYQGQIVCKRK